MATLLCTILITISGSSYSPNITTNNGNIKIAVEDGKDLFVQQGDETSAWSDLATNSNVNVQVEEIKSTVDATIANTTTTFNQKLVDVSKTIQTLSRRSDGLEDTLGFGGNNSTCKSTHCVTDLLVQANVNLAALIAEAKLHTALLEVVANASKTTEAIHAQNIGATVVSTSPLRCPARGGVEFVVGGRNLVNGLDGLYTCTWTLGDFTLVSEGFGASSTNLVKCTPPKWPQVKMPSKHTWDAEFVLLENGVEVAATSKLKTTWFAEAPTMTEIEVLTIQFSEVKNNLYSFNIQVDDVDGDAAAVTLSGTSSNKDFVKEVRVGGDDIVRTVSLPILKPVGKTNLTLTVKDKYGLQRSQTFEFEVERSVGAAPTDLLAYFDFDDNCLLPKYAPASFSDSSAQRINAACRSNQGIFSGNDNQGAAYFGNNDNYRFDFTKNPIQLGSTWSISLWTRHDQCDNNQIPLYFQHPNGNNYYMIDAHAKAVISSGFLYKSHNDASCNSLVNRWTHHVYVDTGSVFVVYINGVEITGYSTNNRNNYGSLKGAYLSNIGNKPGFGTNGHGGYLDELVIWNRALNAEEAKGMYELKNLRQEYGLNLK